MLATEAMEPVETGSTASVRGHIWTGVSRVNSLLQFYFKGWKTPEFRHFWRARHMGRTVAGSRTGVPLTTSRRRVPMLEQLPAPLDHTLCLPSIP
jgi:hypothetical protein